MKFCSAMALAAVLVGLGTGGALAQPAECTGPTMNDPIEITARTDVPGTVVGGEVAARDYAATLVCAEAGVARAQWNLGRMYGTGWGVGQDLATAEIWYRRSAEQGFLNAEISIALTLAAGTPTDAQLAEALTWFIRAANQGDSFAMMRVAQAYEGGLGTPVDLLKAAAWYIVATGFNEPAAFEPMAALQARLQRGAWAEAQDLAGRWADAWNGSQPLPEI